MKSLLKLVRGTSGFVRGTLADAWSILRSPRQSARQIHGVSFYRNAVYIMSNTGVSLILGFVFWIVVARFYTVAEVGYGSALLSAVAFLSFVGTLGFGFGIVRYLPGADNPSRLVNTSLTLSGLAAIAAGFVFVGGLPWWSPELVFVRQNPVFLTAFVAFTAMTTLNIVVSQIFIAFRRSGYALVQGIIWSGLRLVLAVGLAYVFKVFGILASHGLAQAVALGVCLLLFLMHLMPRYRPLPAVHRETSRRLARFSFANYLSEIFWNLPTWILPLMILNTSGAEDNAYFYIAWSLANLLLAIAIGISMSLFAEGTYEEQNVGRNLVSSFKLIVLVLVPAAAIMALLGDRILLLFGGEYSTEGARLLQVLSLASLPASINFLYIGLVRVEARLKGLLLVTGVTALATLVLSYVLLPHLGIVGAGVGWLTTQTALMIFTVPPLVHKLKHPAAT